MVDIEKMAREARRIWFSTDNPECWNEIVKSFLNTEIVPERECYGCRGSKWEFGSINGRQERVDCHICNGTGKLPPITVEQAIKKVME